MPKRVWPREIERGIARAHREGKLTTGKVLAKIRDGTLPGLSQPYPDYADRTFYDALRRVRARKSRGTVRGLPAVADLRREPKPSPPKPSPPARWTERVAAVVRNEAPANVAPPPDPDMLPCPVCRRPIKLSTSKCPGCGELLGLSKPRPKQPPPLPRPRPQLTEQERVTGYRRGGRPY